MSATPRHLIDLLGLDRAWVIDVDEAERLRRGTAGGAAAAGDCGVVFEPRRAPVCRSRSACDLGGIAVDLTRWRSASTNASLPDVTRVLSSMCDLVVIRTFGHRHCAPWQHATIR